MLLFHFLLTVAFLTMRPIPFFGNLFSSLFNPISVPLNVGIIFEPTSESTQSIHPHFTASERWVEGRLRVVPKDAYVFCSLITWNLIIAIFCFQLFRTLLLMHLLGWTIKDESKVNLGLRILFTSTARKWVLATSSDMLVSWHGTILCSPQGKKYLF